jgi:hypothetical protein
METFIMITTVVALIIFLGASVLAILKVIN